MKDESRQPEQGSVLDRLRAIRQETRAQTTHDMEIPGYRGLLVARYAALPWEVVRGLANKQEQGKRNPNIAPMIAADGLASAVVGFFTREPGAKLEPLTLRGEPITYFGDALKEALGIENAETNREITIATFPDEFSLVAHYGEFVEWQTERAGQDDEQIEATAKTDDAVHPTSTSSREPQSSE